MLFLQKDTKNTETSKDENQVEEKGTVVSFVQPYPRLYFYLFIYLYFASFISKSTQLNTLCILVRSKATSRSRRQKKTVKHHRSHPDLLMRCEST